MKQPPLPPLPPHALEVAAVLNPTEFKAGTDLWESVCRAGGADLTNCLLAPGSPNRLEGLTFPVLQIAELVSAVGMQSIRARFVVLRDEKNNPRFSVAMYAAGANDVVLSSYYLARRYWLLPAGSAYERPAPRRINRDAPKHALPKALADYWASSWADTRRYPTSPALFTSAGQQLHGYNFALSDLMDPLRGLNDFNTQVLAMTFGLHTALNFNATTKADAPVATLGLMLQIVKLSDKDEDAAGEDAFDIGTPSPPGP